jgi:hypothetical protein
VATLPAERKKGILLDFFLHIVPLSSILLVQPELFMNLFLFWRCPMLRLRMIVPLCVVGMLCTGFLLGEDKKAEEPIVVRVQLPRYYKQLLLSDQQKNTVYKVRSKYAAEIKKLNEQIAALREKETVDLEKVLTPAQKARLKELRNGGGGKDKEIEEKPAEIQKPTAKKK